ncbi:aldose 1-epimerase family protein [Pediococcus pentosaceus]|uniref:aldose 1-epimerase family protein n=1 Tax=Pediococcus pentosaceus TaxID=1255 RepID=UPI001C7E0571|nr:aldose 1-epimerase family protein [Pediococcus pentosaceus]QYY85915.1 aldose 1-epimerase family protein [Pediococcus pentosaceus]
MTVTLKNDYLTVKINEKGAELSSVKANDGIEYIWQADPAVWGRHAPVLFPFVGRLKDDQFQVEDQTYPMGQHGFARDMDFEAVEQDDQHVIMELNSDTETLQKFPFEFKLHLHFTLKDHELIEHYEVVNPDSKKDLLFSIGGHPGFNLNLGDNQIQMEDTHIRIAPKQVYNQIPLKAPYTDPKNPIKFDATTPLDLTHALFKDDAIILDLKGEQITLMTENEVNNHGIAFTVANAPYLGIWSPYPATANFVCLEPWWGIADTVDFNGELKDKLGVNRLAAQETFNQEFSMSFF